MFEPILAFQLSSAAKSHLSQLAQQHCRELRFFNDLKEFKAWIRENPFDCAVLGSGQQALKAFAFIKRRVQCEFVPTILIGASWDANQIQQRYDEGAFFVFGQGLRSPSQFSNILTSALHQSKYQRHLLNRIKDKQDVVSTLHEGTFKIQTISQARVLARLLSFLTDEPDRIGMGLMEIFVNSIEHGNLELDYNDKTRLMEEDKLQEEMDSRLQREPYKSRFTTVRVKVEDSGKIQFEVDDMGKGFDFQQYLKIDEDRLYESHGRGIAMAKMLAFSKLEYQGKGNLVLLEV